MANSSLVDVAMKEILKPVSDVKIIIRENIFVRDYLPHLLNFDDRRDGILKWLEVCKNPYYPVDVIDENNKVVFSVPPIWARQETRVDYDGKYSVGEIVSRAQKRAEITPKQGEIFFDECLPYMLTGNMDKTDFTRVWKDILIRYGYLDKETDSGEYTDGDFEFVDL